MRARARCEILPTDPMPFDGAPSFQQPKAFVHELSQEQALIAEAQLAKQQALEALQKTEHDRAAFYELALSGSRLNDDQKLLLKKVQAAGGNVEELAKIAYTDPQTNISFTGFDYFTTDAQDVVEAIKGVENRYREAKARHDHFAAEALRQLGSSRELPVNTREVGHLQMPSLPGTEVDAAGKLRRVEQGIAQAWDEHSGALSDHFQHVAQSLSVPFVMPSPDSILARAQQFREAQVPSATNERVSAPWDAASTEDPFASVDTAPDVPTPQEPVIYGPHDYAPQQPNVMPAAAQQTAKKGFFARLLS